MRTTVNIPDELLAEARRQTVRQGRTLGSIIADGLRVVLFDNASVQIKKRKTKLNTYGGHGINSGVDLDNNAELRDVMDEI
jgi:hypothetical protein